MSRQDRWSWFSTRQQQTRRRKLAPNAPGHGFAQGRRLHIEPLEDRRMLAVITVDTAQDTFDGSIIDGDISLRDAVHAANNLFDIDTINFDPAIFATPQTITLVLGDIEITEAVILDGPGQQLLTLDAQQNSRILNISASFGDFSLTGLKLIGGKTTGDNANNIDTTFNGGAIRSLTTGTLTIDQSTISGNSTLGAFAHGGGIFSQGDLILTSSIVSGNSTAGYRSLGGGIRSKAGDVTLTNSIVSGNSTTGSRAEGGGIFAAFGATLTNSTVSGNSTAGGLADGGGIFSIGAVSLTSSTVSGNSTTGVRAYGAGIYSNNSVRLTSSTVSGNSTTGDDATGGGIRTSGAVTLNSSTVSGNSTSGDTAQGGGIRSFGTVTLTSSTVSGNSTSGDSAGGGGIHTSGTITLTSSTVSGNSTTGVRAYGGGIYGRIGDITLASSTVSGNSTAGESARGGGIHSFSTVTLTSSTVSGNSTAGSSAKGGGIYSSGTVTLTSSTVSGNSTAGSSARGGGIYSSGNVTLTRSTVTTNEAKHLSSGGGGGIWSSSTGTTLINHSIISDNSDGSGISADIRPSTGAFIVNFSLTGTFVFPSSGSNNIFNNNPQLGPLADNGGPTETHAPLVGSPAIHAGQPGIIFFPKAYDQRGAPFARIFGGRIDIGAIEDQPIVINSADFDTDGDIDGADFLAWQRGFGTPNANPVDGDADNDNDVDGVDLVVWSNQFGLPAPVAAVVAPLASEPIVAAELIDAAMAIGLARGSQDAETPPLDEEPTFAETYADRAFAAEAIAPTSTFADEEPPGTNPSDVEEAKTPRLADELLERVIG